MYDRYKSNNRKRKNRKDSGGDINMRIEVRNYRDCWMDIKETTMTTIGKDTGAYPTSEWKTKLLKSEHSPIRLGEIRVKIWGIKYWVVGHLVRHHIGIEKFVTTQRTDRTGINRDEIPQGADVNLELHMNFQAIISISRKRMCMCASLETRQAWQAILDEIKKVEPELVALCQPECVYRGHCSEMFPCGYSKSESFKTRLIEYQGGNK